jgi:DNA-binding CsgD family transcriptional regulator
MTNVDITMIKTAKQQETLNPFEQYKQDNYRLLTMAETVPAFKNTVKNIITDLGFSHFHIILDIHAFKYDPSANLILSTLPNSLCETYFEEKDIMHNNIIIEFLVDAESPFHYSHLGNYLSGSPSRLKSIDKVLLVSELMIHHGFHCAFCFPITNQKTGKKMIFSALSEGVEPSEFKRQSLTKRSKVGWLAKMVNNLLTQFQHSNGTRNKLPAKQKELLYALADGMNHQQAADHLGLAHCSVETYCKLIRTYFNARTTISAFYEAIRIGEIVVDKPVKRKSPPLVGLTEKLAQEKYDSYIKNNQPIDGPVTNSPQSIRKKADRLPPLK